MINTSTGRFCQHCGSPRAVAGTGFFGKFSLRMTPLKWAFVGGALILFLVFVIGDLASSVLGGGLSSLVPLTILILLGGLFWTGMTNGRANGWIRIFMVIPPLVLNGFVGVVAGILFTCSGEFLCAGESLGTGVGVGLAFFFGLAVVEILMFLTLSAIIKTGKHLWQGSS
jgi:hypothetical protein